MVSYWDYRKPITIVENTGSDLTNMQVNVIVDTSGLVAGGKMLSTGSDMRFTDTDEVTRLEHWVESDMNTTGTSVWVKIPSMSSGTSGTYYMYYGENTATNVENGSSVFLFFDAFSGGTLDSGLWSTTGVAAGTTASISGGKLVLTSDANGKTCYINTQDATVCQANRVITYGITNSGDVHDYAGGLMGYGAGQGPGDYYFGRFSSNTYYRNGAETSISATKWYATETKVVVELLEDTMNYSDSEGVTDNARSISLGSGYDEAFYLFTRPVDSSSSRAEINHVYVRNYVSSVPTFSVGTEESSPGAVGSLGTVMSKPVLGSSFYYAGSAFISGGGTAGITWQISNNNGSTWTSGGNGTELGFTGSGNKIRWKAFIPSGGSIISNVITVAKTRQHYYADYN